MSESIKSLDAAGQKLFWERVKLFYAAWKKLRGGWGDADSIIVVVGSGDVLYSTSGQIQLWLFGLEFSSCALVMTKENLDLIAGKKVCQYFQPLTESGAGGGEIVFQTHKKNKADPQENAKKVRSLLTDCERLGYLEKEKPAGTFGETIASMLQTLTVELVRFDEGFSDLTMIKQDIEVNKLGKAGEFTSKCMKFLQGKLESYIEAEKNPKHSEIRDMLEALTESPHKVKSQLRKSLLETCLDPSIQSGGVYSLKTSAGSNDEKLHYDYGTVTCTIGYRFRNFCAVMARTFLIDASPDQSKVYSLMVRVFSKIVSTLRHNTSLSKVWQGAVNIVYKNRPDLVPHLLKNCGHGIGINIRDRHYVINEKSQKFAKAGMTFYVCVGFQNVVDKDKKEKGLDKAATYSVIIGDTVVVTDQEAEFKTHFKRKMVEYQLAEDDNEPSSSSEEEVVRKKKERRGSLEMPDINLGGHGRVTRRNNKRTQKMMLQQAEERRKREQSQVEKRQKLDTRLKKRYKQMGGLYKKKDESKKFEDPRCYPTNGHLPKLHSVVRKVQVDVEREAVVLPIVGMMVPFHIKLIKSVSLPPMERDNNVLRISFYAPMTRGVGTRAIVKQPDVVLAHPNAMFIKELTFKSKSAANFHHVVRQIKDIQKRLKIRAKESKETPLIEQPKLIRLNTTPPKLRSLSQRPNLGGRKKGTGILEAHRNGFRYVGRSEDLRIVYDNIKCCIFQPANKTASVILHFRLEKAIKMGRKGSRDFQVYHDVVERTEEVGRSGYDVDGLREEQRERERRGKLNKQFKNFVLEVEKLWKRLGIEMRFEYPEMALGFPGVPDKQCITLYPTENCVVGLEDSNPFVLVLKDVDLVYFERVSFSLRNFDAVFVWKDYQKEPLRVCAVPREHFDVFQTFLDNYGIAFYQGKINLDWKGIMNRVRNSPQDFIEQGGWTFLKQTFADEEPAPKAEEGGGNGNSDYAPSQDEYSEDEYSEEDEEEYDDDDDYESEEYSSEGEQEEEEEGMSWEELEKKAEDRQKGRKRRPGSSGYNAPKRQRRRR